MWRLVAARAAQAVAIVAIVATAIFFIIHLAPGDPFAGSLDGPGVPPEVRDAWRARYGFDRPLPEQYVRYLVTVAGGDLGYSFSQHRPVADALRAVIPNTLLLMGTAVALSLVVGVIAGVYQATRARRAGDRVTGGILLVFYSVPDFWLALMAMLVFAYLVPVFPTSGIVDPVMHEYLGPWGRLVDRVRHLALPALTLTLLASAGIARHQRSAMLDVLHADYVRTARAKGVGEARLLIHHALRNALGSTITLLGLMFPALLGGAVFVEYVFAWPGMGMLVTSAVANRDYALVTAIAVVSAIMVATGSMLADILTAAADPRLRDA